MRRLGPALLVAAAAAMLVQCGGSTPTTVTPPPGTASLQSLSLGSTSVSGGSSVQGTATLSSGAPAGGANVTLSSSNTAAATVPGSVVVPQGSTSATFTVTTLAVGTTVNATISGTYLGVTQSAALSITAAAPAIHADFTVIPDSGTTVSAGQCSASLISGTSTQKLLCTFDASSATPVGGITEYRWALPGTTTAQAGAKLSDPVIPCGGFSSAGTDKDVTLTITATGGGTDTTKKTVTFVKGSPC